MIGSRMTKAAGILAICCLASALQAQPAGRITGLGGVFVKSKDPRALRLWYKEVLGIAIESWGGALLRYDAPGHPKMAVWNPMRENSDYVAPSNREFMIDFAVDDLDAFVARLEAKGVAIIKRDSGPTGRYAWILDPDGTKIELWQPKAG